MKYCSPIAAFTARISGVVDRKREGAVRPFGRTFAGVLRSTCALLLVSESCIAVDSVRRAEEPNRQPSATGEPDVEADRLTGDGLLGNYYKNPDMTGVVEQRVDPQIEFPVGFATDPVDMGDAPPGTAMRADDNWSVRWTGHVLIDSPGEWTFHTDSDDGVRLWVDGQKVIDNWTIHPLTRDSGKIALSAGWKPIRLDFYQSGHTSEGNKAAIRLSFEGPHQPEAVIPETHLASTLLTNVDIGSVGTAGYLSIDHSTGQYAIEASGADIQYAIDAFHFAYVPLDGDGSIKARVNSIVDTNEYAKGGVMFRESLSPKSRNVMMEMKSTTGSEFQYRATTGGKTTVGPRNFDIDPPYWVRLDRSGSTFTGYTSKDGETWEQRGMVTMPLPDTLLVGLAATAHNNDKLTTARFEKLSISGVPTTSVAPPTPGTGVSGFISLLNTKTFDPYKDDGRDVASFYRDDDEFYTFRGDRFDIAATQKGPGYDEDEGKNPSDPSTVFRLTNLGMLHILGIPNSGQNEPFGYISTEDDYRNYHLSLEYKWGVAKFHPRKNAKRDSGLLYHAVGPDLVWTTDVETQIQEGDTGDFFFLGEGVALGSTQGVVTIAPGTNMYQPAGESLVSEGGVTKSRTVDSRTGWNRVEVIVEGDNVTAIVNGVVVNRASNMSRRDGDTIIPLTEGKIALQSEGAEIFYRNVQIKPTHAVGGRGGFRVLVFQETAEAGSYERRIIAAAQAAIQALGKASGFAVDIANESTGAFTDANLSRYAAVIWNNTAGDVLNESEQQAFERYVQTGGGFVGLHSAARAEDDWQWYGELVGARVIGQPRERLATLLVDKEATKAAGGRTLRHPAADSLPEAGWQRVDALYDYQLNPRNRVNVLLTVDDTSRQAEGRVADTTDHPIAWWHHFDGGRSFYTGLGHRPRGYHEPLYLQHLLGGIEYAAGVSRVPPEQAIVLFDGTSVDRFELADGGPAGWQIDERGNLAIVPGAGNIRTKDKFTDYRLHLEFKVPATAPDTAEQCRGNSGVYLHGSYELQILDSYGDMNFNAQHAGSIYGVAEPKFNAALPAEVWQVYDVDFTAPRFNERGEKTESARITAYLNGVLAHDNVAVEGTTRGGLPETPGPQPFCLQDHDRNSKIKFRNIWVVPLSPPTALAGDLTLHNESGRISSDRKTQSFGHRK